MTTSPPPPARGDGLERARRLVREGPTVAWESPSRFGPAGVAARRLLRRTLQAYALRQHDLDEALVGALDASAVGAEDRLARLERATHLAREATHATTLDPVDVVDATTAAGPLWLNLADNLVTPGIVEHQLYETHVSALLPRLLKPGMTFVDVGANIGYFSVLASKLVGAEGLVIAVEPGPANLALLRAKLWRNGCTNAVVLPIAAYTHRGHVQLVLNPEGGAGNWVQPGEVPMPSVLAPCAPLDELLGDLRVDVLKTDAEGSDVQAIRGMERAIRRSRGITVVAEFWTEAYGGRGESPAEVLAYYDSLGLRLSRLEDSGELTPATHEALLSLAGSVPFINIVLA